MSMSNLVNPADFLFDQAHFYLFRFIVQNRTRFCPHQLFKYINQLDISSCWIYEMAINNFVLKIVLFPSTAKMKDQIWSASSRQMYHNNLAKSKNWTRKIYFLCTLPHLCGQAFDEEFITKSLFYNHFFSQHSILITGY